MKLKFPLLDSLLEAGRAALDYLTQRSKSRGKRKAEEYLDEEKRAEAAAAARASRAAKRRKLLQRGAKRKTGKAPAKRKR